MTTKQKAIFFLYAGLIMLLGTVGGVEQCPDLATWDGVYLAVFAFAGIAFMAIGAAYANAGTREFLDNPTLR
jgi:hypothetical protein